MDNSVRVTNGVRSLSDEDFVGLFVDELVESVTDIFQLDGNETVEVRSEGGNFRVVEDDYQLRGGDSVRFARAGGTKG